MEKVWLKHYPPNVPQEIDVGAYSSIRDILEKSCAKFRDRPAYTNMGVTITFGELDKLSRDFAAFLQGLPSPRRASGWRSCRPMRCSIRSPRSASCAPAWWW